MLGLGAATAAVPSLLAGGTVAAEVPVTMTVTIVPPPPPIVGQFVYHFANGKFGHMLFGADDRWHPWDETIESYERITGGLLRLGPGLGSEGSNERA
jgi:hypothetical protein